MSRLVLHVCRLKTSDVGLVETQFSMTTEINRVHRANEASAEHFLRALLDTLAVTKHSNAFNGH